MEVKSVRSLEFLHAVEEADALAGGKELAVDLAGALDGATDGDPVNEVGGGFELIVNASGGEEFDFGGGVNVEVVGRDAVRVERV